MHITAALSAGVCTVEAEMNPDLAKLNQYVTGSLIIASVCCLSFDLMICYSQFWLAHVDQDSDGEGPLSDDEAARRVEAAKNFKPGFF